ncbi:LLM class flavin-dependent oxidoreductase [Roseomonas sp. HJA6]|uniref:LLM class flavin-dependent oxidoreductase n=1 Tax=Roseomonas alba TaxID=2846776 RepID=A0ABS7A9W1_9PROT|nr:LLM class flavin-dependent oxidoreductase [Neoroseomonas alba]MBW6399085.1 LLM class flavin-dependent oxidoreductase [Neoroseomonas alba]
MTSPRQIHLGVSMRNPYHIAAWRHPEAPSRAEIDLDNYVRVAQIAERGKFDMAFLADGVGVRAKEHAARHMIAHDIVNFEPMTLLGALSMVTSRIGLVATASTTYNEPYHIARKFASLDHISKGRAGWNLVTSWSEAEALNFGLDEPPEKLGRYDRAAEFVEVVKGLWESWDDDAFPMDKASGTFFDPAKMHVLDHRGRHFKVRGPLNVPRSPQGRPVIIQAGATDRGRDIAAAHADVIYAASQTLAEAQAFYRSVKDRMPKYGRRPEQLAIMPGFSIIVAPTEAEAQRKFRVLQDLLDPKVGLMMLYNMIGDFSGYDIDGPVPRLDAPPQVRSEILYGIAERENLSIRQLYERIAVSRGHHSIVGTPEQVVDEMEEWFTQGGADGFNILPPHLPGGLEDVVDMVVPELQRRGLFRTEYDGNTLREHLGVVIAPGERSTQHIEGEVA